MRHDIYGPIHKGLRLSGARMLIALGSTDWRDAGASGRTLAALRLHLALGREHLAHEDTEFHPVLRDCDDVLTATLEHDHGEHGVTFAELDAMIAAVEAADLPDTRCAAGHALYLRFSVYFADDLAHMAREELVALPILQAAQDDAALMAMEGRVVGSIAPDRMLDYHAIMLPGMTPAERAGFLGFLRQAVPAEAFAHVRDVVARDCLDAGAYAQLLAELEVPVAA
ncbi:hemerythrin domain-containing protein [Stakelama tenebrarum]|uniref:Uncharacterized protein n=1 Tax=Stakelama tenebrarum TaxID=2711215 RepID=A0A6G6Y0Q4_9SPHN|nr:hemerythrin domain-containing protein [Sphingosinithalassobacter tenebrarum]QIG78387.1 hypothetical protein G5C33_00310 [Sphingosinithalassobacter tenebrarum]